jgi:hypothetical protein
MGSIKNLKHLKCIPGINLKYFEKISHKFKKQIF